jgi:RimJ/RimL family protein N-acetyltransferase
MRIETTRLVLREPVESDAEEWTAMLTDPEVSRYLGPPVDSRAAVLRHIRIARERHGSDGFGLLAVVRKEDEHVIGRSGFLVWNRRTWSPTSLRNAGDESVVEIGWTLNRGCWGLGYATEAGKACRDYGFAELGLDRVAAVIQPANLRSASVARRLEMHFEQAIRTANGFDAQLWISDRPGSRRSRPTAPPRYP